jgi:hypothetical protein
MSQSRTLERAAGLPPLLIQVVTAALDGAVFGVRTDRRDEADALVDCGRLAAVAVPACGVLAPTDDELYMALERIAAARFGLDDAKAAFRKALEKIPSVTTRRVVADAAVDERVATDSAFFYGGLAFGITFACLGHSLPQERPVAKGRPTTRTRTRRPQAPRRSVARREVAKG